MTDQLERNLATRFTFMKHPHPEKKEMGILCECGDGWYDLIVNLCQEIETYCLAHNVDMNTIEVLQVKEKYGELRFYLNHVPAGLYDITNKYQKLSKDVCEVCGGKGERRGRTWIETLCDQCYVGK